MSAAAKGHPSGPNRAYAVAEIAVAINAVSDTISVDRRQCAAWMSPFAIGLLLVRRAAVAVAVVLVVAAGVAVVRQVDGVHDHAEDALARDRVDRATDQRIGGLAAAHHEQHAADEARE